jgi:membrane protease YdiL (CAAX protease family)
MFLRISLFYVLTWFFLILLGGFQQATGILPSEVGLAQWGPGIAALLMLVLFRRDGHKITFFTGGIPVSRYLYAALIPVGVSLIVLAVRSMVSIEPSSDTSVQSALLPMLLWMPFGALGEELGWRGYLHKKLDPRMNGLLSSLLVGILWMPIHIHFLIRGPIFVFFLALLIISFSIVIYALVQDTGFNVLVAGVFHLAINLSNLLFLDVIYETQFMMVNAMVWVLIAALVVWQKRQLFLTTKVPS